MAGPITVFICGRGLKKPGTKYKCTKCEKYFESSEAWKIHECPKVSSQVTQDENVLQKTENENMREKLLQRLPEEEVDKRFEATFQKHWREILA